MITLTDDINEFRQTLFAQAQLFQHLRPNVLPIPVFEAHLQVINMPGQLQDGGHGSCRVVIKSLDIVVAANRLADKGRQPPMLGDQIADNAMIGVKARVFVCQVDPEPWLVEPHGLAIGWKPLHQHRHTALVKQASQVRLIGEDIAHRDALVGNQHRQFGDRL